MLSFLDSTGYKLIWMGEASIVHGREGPEFSQGGKFWESSLQAREREREIFGHNQPGSCVSKTNQLHADICKFSYIKLENDMQIIVKGSVVFFEVLNLN